MQTLYLDKIGVSQVRSQIKNYHVLDYYIFEYRRFYKKIAEKAKFDDSIFNKIGFHKYQAGSIGITPHQDYETHINLISIFNLVGEAGFYYCEDKDGNGSRKIDSSPGSLILLRAPRNEDEEKYRPFHYINPMSNERLSLNVRRKMRK